jgi:tRNA-dihydrouridine synthase
MFFAASFIIWRSTAISLACIGNPWIFRQARQMLAGEPVTRPTIDEQREVLLQHFDLSVAVNGEKRAGPMMRKFGIKFATHHPTPEAVKQRFCRVSSTEEWRAVLDEHYCEAPVGVGG